MPQRQGNIVKREAAKPSKQIGLPISPELYDEVVEQPAYFRTMLDVFVANYPELFPEQIKDGYQLYGFERTSMKMPEV